LNRQLPLDATCIATEDGWLITLPARFERVDVTRESVETEEVLLRRERRSSLERVRAETWREELRVEATGDAEVTQTVPGGPTRHK
jgi:stress response protein YsnF